METKWNRKCVSSHSLFVSHFAFCSGLKHRCFVKFITLQPSNRLKSNRVHCWRDLLSAHADKQGVDIVVYCFVCVVCTVTDFSAEDKASGLKFCTAVYRRPRQGITHFCEYCSPRSQKSDKSASARATPTGM